VDAVPERVRVAAARVLAHDGQDHVLHPWQVAYLMALSEGREADVRVQTRSNAMATEPPPPRHRVARP
jgi:hypothetical protein